MNWQKIRFFTLDTYALCLFRLAGFMCRKNSVIISNRLSNAIRIDSWLISESSIIEIEQTKSLRHLRFFLKAIRKNGTYSKQQLLSSRILRFNHSIFDVQPSTPSKGRTKLQRYCFGSKCKTKPFEFISWNSHIYIFLFPFFRQY